MVPEHRDRERQADSASHDESLLRGRFPMGIMTAALAATILAYGWLSWSAYQAYQELSHFKALQLRTEELRGVIIHLDEVLTMSARMAASTGDLGWERRYRKFEPELDSAIKEAINLAPSPQTVQAAAKTDEANVRLVEMENLAFDLVRKKRHAEASAVLFGQAYETQKKIYSDGMREFINQLRQQADTDLANQKREAVIDISASVGAIPVVLFVWMYALGNLRRWRTALFMNIEHRKHIQEELRKINDMLELRIQERTAGLSKVNVDLQAEIAERQRAENELTAAKEAAEAATVAKSEFLASMSHEIRTPMNAIVGMADLLAETPLTQEQKEYVRIFRRAGGTLLTLINDILDLSKVEAGHMELESVDFDLHDVVEKTVEVAALRAHEKGLELTSHVASDVPADLVGDPTRLRQVLLNLLGNAVKFTERGEVALKIELEREDSAGQGNRLSDECALRFSVSDTGIGIPADKVETIFERFTQVDSSTTRRYGGTGLGLAISKRLVELMGGRIRVESRVGQGTTFFFTLHARLWTGPKRRVARHHVDMHNLNTLVVDDNATNRLILHEMLAGWKARVTEAAGGEEALARLRRAQRVGDPYQLVLLDCRMPDMDGFQVAEAMKCEQGLTNVTIMMLTSDGRGGDLARAKELGLASYMVKPVKRPDLLTAISAVLRMPLPPQRESPPITVPTPADVQRPLHILLAEDAEDNRLLIRAYLKHTTHRLDIAENGEIACGKYKSGWYDLVLMDMQMPVLDGYDATRAIREWERENHRPPTPILALTAHALKGDEAKGLEAGCTAYLTKPIRKATLLAAISEHAGYATKEVGR